LDNKTSNCELDCILWTFVGFHLHSTERQRATTEEPAIMAVIPPKRERKKHILELEGQTLWLIYEGLKYPFSSY